MKSIIQEASSISKAVELAWTKANKPKEFSIKVFQEAQKNFIGMTTRSAKIAFLFSDESITNNIRQQVKKIEQKPKKTETKKSHFKTETDPLLKAFEKNIEKKIKKAEQKPKKQQEMKQPKALKPKEKKNISEQTEKTPKKILWDEKMVQMAQEWTSNFLTKINKEDISFTTKISRYHLKIHFSEALKEDANQQKNIFRNIAFLVMQSIRNKYKKQFRYHKIVLTSE